MFRELTAKTACTNQNGELNPHQSSSGETNGIDNDNEGNDADNQQIGTYLQLCTMKNYMFSKSREISLFEYLKAYQSFTNKMTVASAFSSISVSEEQLLYEAIKNNDLDSVKKLMNAHKFLVNEPIDENKAK